MLLEIIFTILFGICIGIFTGLIPGIHVNLIGVFLLSLFSIILYQFSTIYLIVFIVAVAITHTFIDFIPSIFLGCPDTDTELSILPGHQLLKNGSGYEAIMLSNIGSLSAIFILIIILPISIILIPKIAELTKQIIPYLLISVLLILIFLENKKISSIIVFSLTGILGLITLNLENLNQPILPLLTGLFGASNLILSIKNKIQIPEQKIIKPKINSIKPFLGAAIAAPICSFLPGLGSGQAAIIGNTITRNKNNENFLVLLGVTNTLVMGFSFISLYLISKTRTGAAATIKELIGIFSWKILVLILITILISGIISFFLTKHLAKFFSKKINKINYTKISITTLIILLTLTFFVSGFLGLLILILSTLTGIYCISLKVRRTNMMGCLLIPTILFYLF